MAPTAKSTTGRARSRDLRERLRAQGLRQIYLWVPDTTSPEFRLEAHRQSLAVTGQSDGQAFIDAVSDWPGE